MGLLGSSQLSVQNAILALRMPPPALVTAKKVSPPVPQTGGVSVATGWTTAGQQSPVPVGQTSGSTPGWVGKPPPPPRQILPLVSSGAYGQPGAAAPYVGPPVTTTAQPFDFGTIALVGGLALVGYIVLKRLL